MTFKSALRTRAESEVEYDRDYARSCGWMKDNESGKKSDALAQEKISSSSIKSARACSINAHFSNLHFHLVPLGASWVTNQSTKKISDSIKKTRMRHCITIPLENPHDQNHRQEQPC